MVKCACCGSKLDMGDILFSKQDAYYKGKPLGLTKMERRVLQIMWDHDFIGFTTLSKADMPARASAAMMSRLRVKLNAVGAPFVIRTADGGYC